MLLKIRSKVSLKHLIKSKGIRGDSKKWAIEIEALHNYKPSEMKKDLLNDPMWK